MIRLETERLIIRNFQTGDGQGLHETICQYQSSDLAIYDQKWPTSSDEIKKITEWFAGGDSYLAVCLKADGRLIGFVSLSHETEDSQDFDLGYVFRFDYHGQGYATEACRALLDHAFRELRSGQVLSGTAAPNHASCRLLERLGFKRISESSTSFWSAPDGTPITFLGYSYCLTRDEWEKEGPHSIRQQTSGSVNSCRRDST